MLSATLGFSVTYSIGLRPKGNWNKAQQCHQYVCQIQLAFSDFDTDDGDSSKQWWKWF